MWLCAFITVTINTTYNNIVSGWPMKIDNGRFNVSDENFLGFFLESHQWFSIKQKIRKPFPSGMAHHMDSASEEKIAFHHLHQKQLANSSTRNFFRIR